MRLINGGHHMNSNCIKFKDNKKLILKHLTFIDRKWTDEKLKKYFDDYYNAKINMVNRLLR